MESGLDCKNRGIITIYHDKSNLSFEWAKSCRSLSHYTFD